MTFHPQYSPLSPPEIQFNAVDLRDVDKPASGGVHGPYRQPFIDPLELVYLGRPLTFRLPPIAILSLLSYFARLERIKIAVAPHLPPNRVVADAQGREGPTQQDIADFNSHPRIHIPNSFANVTSDRMTSDFFDHYWSWMISPYDERSSLFVPDSPRYLPGYLSGHWRGTAVVRSNARSLGGVLTSIHLRRPTAQVIGAG